MFSKNKNVLFLTHSYNSFQKESVNSICKYYNNCSVLVRSNPIAEISKYIKIPYLDAFKKDSKIDLTAIPSNLNVYLTPIIYAPIDSQYKKLGERHFKVVKKTIKKKNIEFDLIHSHFSWSSGYVGAKLKEKYNVPFVVTAHGYDIYSLPFKDAEWRDKIKYVLNSADHIITVSNSNSECITKLDINTPVTVIPNGYNADLFYPMDSQKCREKLNLPSSKKIFLTVGNLLEVKGHKYLIEAMHEVVNYRKDVVCYIVGSGPLENKLKKQINKAGLNDYVKLVGGKSHDKIPIWMNACDVFVLPSLNEGNPTVMFECLGCGKPFIGTTVGGIPEIITSDDYGLLCESADPNNLAENILIALNMDWDCKKIKEYSQQFTWENIGNNIYSLHKSLL